MAGGVGGRSRMGCGRRDCWRDGLFGGKLDVRSSLSGFRTCRFWTPRFGEPGYKPRGDDIVRNLGADASWTLKKMRFDCSSATIIALKFGTIQVSSELWRCCSACRAKVYSCKSQVDSARRASRDAQWSGAWTRSRAKSVNGGRKFENDTRFWSLARRCHLLLLV